VVAGHILEVDVQRVVGGIDLDFGNVPQRAFLDQLAAAVAQAGWHGVISSSNTY